MKKTNKIIIAFAVAIAVAAAVLVVSLVNPGGFGEEKETKYSLYTLEPTTAVTNTPTESWVDLNAIAGDLATTTDESTTVPDSSTSVITTLMNGVGSTVLVYVDQNGNIIDPNDINKVTTTDVDDTATFDTTGSDSTTEASFGSYEINENGIITKYLGDKRDLIIPSKEQGRTVTGIATGCFQGSDIRSVVIPETVTYIGEYAFADCKSLKSVTFMDNAATVTIGQRAFQYCVSLKNIVLPAVKSLGNASFIGCTALESVKLSTGSEKIGNNCFEDCKALTELSIPKSVTSIGSKILLGCDTSKIVIYCDSNSEAEKYAGTEIATQPYK